MANRHFDYLITGAGIVGLTVARELVRRYPRSSVAIVDKEAKIGVHASGRNSGVVHSGIYYGPKTLKAKVCAEGGRRLLAFAKDAGISSEKFGKVIVAHSKSQIPSLELLMSNAEANGICAYRIDNSQLHELEPHAADAAAAIHCPDTAVIDIHGVLNELQRQLTDANVQFLLGTKARSVQNDRTLLTSDGAIDFGYLFNCAGAYADALAKSCGLAEDLELVPFKGIYWKLAPHANHLVRSSIYPVPDPSMPFLGVHLTRGITGDVYVGPTAIPALGRENYGILKGIRPKEAVDVAGRLASLYVNNKNNFRAMAHAEVLKYYKPRFFNDAKKLCPTLKSDDMIPTPKVGIRPQLVNKRTGTLEMDYVFEQTEHSIHVLNAISPAFTSSFAFAELIVDKSRAGV